MKHKEIVLNSSTVSRIDLISERIKKMTDARSNIFLTILEHENIDLNLFDFKYDDGKLVVLPKELKKV